MINDNDLKNGTPLGGPTLKRQFTPRDLDLANLSKLNHVEWLEDFSKVLGLSTGVQMTPKREGIITRLHWAALWVKHLEKTVKQASEKVTELEKKLKELEGSEGR